MPVYEYLCKDCRNEFKKLTRVEQADSIACPTCGTQRVARLLSVTAHATGDNAEMGGACNVPMNGCAGNPGACGCRFAD